MSINGSTRGGAAIWIYFVALRRKYRVHLARHFRTPASNGTLRDHDELREYFAFALKAYNEFPFELLHYTKSVHSVVLVYRSINELIVAEMMEADEDGKIVRVNAHFGNPES